MLQEILLHQHQFECWQFIFRDLQKYLKIIHILSLLTILCSYLRVSYT